VFREHWLFLRSTLFDSLPSDSLSILTQPIHHVNMFLLVFCATACDGLFMLTLILDKVNILFISIYPL
ncbi:hypothetical protein, partial [Dendrosporobacter sp. 1207_IL3150]|uniref:hypothetical protein n=1 Tax=Dendrosporobacter sp. 1207_IL3150 TaxID=3084054 RepID=UPI002FDA9491